MKIRIRVFPSITEDRSKLLYKFSFASAVDRKNVIVSGEPFLVSRGAYTTEQLALEEAQMTAKEENLRYE